MNGEGDQEKGKAEGADRQQLAPERNRPSEAMKRAPARAPNPRADWRSPFVVASPWRILTAQAGISVAKANPKRLIDADESDDRPDHGMAGDVDEAFLEVGHDRALVRPGDEAARASWPTGRR